MSRMPRIPIDLQNIEDTFALAEEQEEIQLNINVNSSQLTDRAVLSRLVLDHGMKRMY